MDAIDNLTMNEKPCEEHDFVPWFNCPECCGRRAEPDDDKGGGCGVL